ncbi:MAG: transglutaminase domain-containing protein [Porphyromonadaceae bacterium]|nr:transglutaminase domain-containing protein [Porphyromonadaceae bacterium]
MHSKHLLSTFVLGAILVSSCTKQEPLSPQTPSTPSTEEPQKEQPATLFPKPDNSIELTGYPAERLLKILSIQKIDRVIDLGATRITQEQLGEIKNLSDQLVKDSGASTQLEKHQVLFKWITSKVKYGHVFDPSIPDFNSAYSSYKYQKAICQGYANLLKVMCYTQGINAPVVNGLARFNTLGSPAGHAWNYVLLDGKWHVSDPTNGIFYEADRKDKFNFLLPERLDFALWQDDYLTYIYENQELTVGEVHGTVADGKLMVPYSIGGIRISNFNPTSLPKSVREIYLGINIKHLGLSDNRRLLHIGSEIEKIAIDPENKYLEDFRGSIYERGEKTSKLILIPARQKKVYLKAEKEIAKNTLYNHLGIEELHFSEGTEVIMDYAVEKCPSLKAVYVPQSVKTIGAKAFAECSPELKVIRY